MDSHLVIASNLNFSTGKSSGLQSAVSLLQHLQLGRVVSEVVLGTVDRWRYLISSISKTDSEIPSLHQLGGILVSIAILSDILHQLCKPIRQHNQPR